MTKTEIIAELRRSALEDKRPWMDMNDDAFDSTLCFWQIGDGASSTHASRMAILFVAHALEDECAAT